MSTYENYSIHDSKTGNVLVPTVTLLSDDVESISSDNAEGHFRADALPELAQLGDVTVYAVLH